MKLTVFWRWWTAGTTSALGTAMLIGLACSALVVWVAAGPLAPDPVAYLGAVRVAERTVRSDRSLVPGACTNSTTRAPPCARTCCSA
mgnify:CR=1 FL=1